MVEGTNNEAKAHATRLTIKMVNKSIVRNINLEGDSQIIVNFIVKGESFALKIKKIIKIIRNYLANFKKFQVTHTLREGNVLAMDCLRWQWNLTRDS